MPIFNFVEKEREMSLKPCGCGLTPDKLYAYGDVEEYTFICGDCCGEWFVEVETNWEIVETAQHELFKKAWNNAHRKSSRTRPQEVKRYSNIDILMRPTFWLRIYPTNEGWDKKINQLIDSRVGVKRFSRYQVIFDDGTVVWVSNFPYAYGSNGLNDGYLPSRKTVLRLSEYIAKNIIT